MYGFQVVTAVSAISTLLDLILSSSRTTDPLFGASYMLQQVSEFLETQDSIRVQDSSGQAGFITDLLGVWYSVSNLSNSLL